MFRRDPIATDYIADEDFPFYFGDVDLCKRIYDNGYKIFLLPSAEVIHFQGSSFKKASRTWAYNEHRSSLIKYCKKYHKSKVMFVKLILLRNELNEYLRAKGISTGVHYEPIHRYRIFGNVKVNVPVTERVWTKLLTLPLYPDMTEEEFEKVMDEIIRFGKERGL